MAAEKKIRLGADVSEGVSGIKKIVSSVEELNKAIENVEEGLSESGRNIDEITKKGQVAFKEMLKDTLSLQKHLTEVVACLEEKARAQEKAANQSGDLSQQREALEVRKELEKFKKAQMPGRALPQTAREITPAAGTSQQSAQQKEQNVLGRGLSSVALAFEKLKGGSGFFGRKNESKFEDALEEQDRKDSDDERSTGFLSRILEEVSDINKKMEGGGDKPASGGRGGGFFGGYYNNSQYGPGGYGGGLFRSGMGALGFGAMLSLTGFLGTAIYQGKQIDESRRQLDGLRRGQSYEAMPRGLFVGSMGNQYGMTAPEFFDYSRNQALATGRTNVYEAGRQLGFERAYGMADGQLNDLGGFRLQTKKDATLVAEEFASALKDKGVFNVAEGDYALLNQQLGSLTQLFQKQSEVTSSLDTRLTANLVSGLAANVGGRFATQQNTGTILGLNEAIVNPDNQFKQAAIFRAIQSVDPSVSLYEAMGIQEKGLFSEKGGRVAKQLIDKFASTGDTEYAKLNLKKLFGLDNETVDNLFDAYNRNDLSFFDKLGKDIRSEGDLQKAVTQRSREGSELTGTMSKYISTMLDKVGSLGETIIEKFDTLIQIFADRKERGAGEKLDRFIFGDEKVDKQNVYNKNFPMKEVGRGVYMQPQGPRYKKMDDGTLAALPTISTPQQSYFGLSEGANAMNKVSKMFGGDSVWERPGGLEAFSELKNQEGTKEELLKKLRGIAIYENLKQYDANKDYAITAQEAQYFGVKKSDVEKVKQEVNSAKISDDLLREILMELKNLNEAQGRELIKNRITNNR